MAETRSGVERVDEILGVEGVDGVFIGPYDLALSLGFGSVLDGAVVATIESVIGRARERGGSSGSSPGTASWLGLLPAVDLLGVDTDAAALRAGLKLLLGPPRPESGAEGGGEGGCCDTRSHVVSELVEEVWLMPGT
jgi:4-hydroxy-2-oxoheptanedioate aldolase